MINNATQLDLRTAWAEWGQAWVDLDQIKRKFTTITSGKSISDRFDAVDSIHPEIVRAWDKINSTRNRYFALAGRS